MQYSYQALETTGFLQKGTLDAPSEAAALAALQERELVPLEISAGKSATEFQFAARSSSIRRTDLVAVIREIATLLNSGVALAEAFSTLLEATSHPRLREALSSMNSAIRGGDGFSVALEKSQLHFPKYVYALSKAGEATGDLGSSLARCAEQLEFDEQMRSEAREALTYPMILVLTGIAAIAFIFSFVVPRFAGMLKGRNVDLPLLSKWVLGTGVYVHDHWIAVIVVFGLMIASGIVLFRNAKTMQHFVAFLRRLPVLSGWVAGGETARWTAMLAVLVQSKVPILMSIELASVAVQLADNSRQLRGVEDDVRKGKKLSVAVEERHLLEGTSLTMLKVGEKSGQLGAMLAYVASYSAEKQRALQRRLVALIEPISILLIGLSLGVIMVGVIMAMTSLTEIKL